MKAAIIIAGLLSLSAVASAESGVTVSGDWGYGVDADGSHYAVTVNASKSGFGQFCSSQGNCGYIVGASATTCDDGVEYAGLINSVVGARHFGANHVTLVCSKNRMLIKEFDLVDQAVRNASSIGIVGPLEDGTFAVSRFSLTGSTRAVDGMRASAQLSKEPPAARQADIRI